MRLALCLILLAVVCGCANPYSQFYTDFLDGRSIEDVPEFVPHQGEPSLYVTGDPDQDFLALLENGYAVIGYASFNAGWVDTGMALQQAKKIGAAIVLVQSQYTNTVIGAIPYTVQNPSQMVTTQHSGSMWGSMGHGSYSGTSTSMVPGGYTTYMMPYAVNRYDYNAAFWAKTRMPCLGVHVVDLTDDLRRQIGTNRGVLVHAVIKGSPAFNADVMRGDVITKIGEDITPDRKSFGATMQQYAGQEVVLETYRDGVKREVRLRLNSKEY